MKILCDISVFLKNETGIGVYFKNLLFSLAKIDKENEYFLFSSSFKDRFKKENIPPFKNLNFLDLRIPVKFIDYFLYRKKLLSPVLFFQKKFDITHSPIPSVLKGGRIKIITVHDLSFIDIPEESTKEALKRFKKRFKREIDSAEHIISVSNFTKERILELFGEKYSKKITVIYHGSDILEIDEEKLEFKLPEKYFIFIGTVEKRKNLVRLIKGIGDLLKKHNLKLILVGSDSEGSKEVYEEIEKGDLKNFIIRFPYVKREELKFLLKNSLALLYPSIYEGFGLPPLEAVYLEKPVIASRIPPIEEIYGDYPYYFDPFEPESIKEAVEEFLKNSYDKKRIALAKEIKEKLTWETSAKKTLRLYKELSGEDHS